MRGLARHSTQGFFARSSFCVYYVHWVFRQMIVMFRWDTETDRWSSSSVGVTTSTDGGVFSRIWVPFHLSFSIRFPKESRKGLHREPSARKWSSRHNILQKEQVQLGQLGRYSCIALCNFLIPMSLLLRHVDLHFWTDRWTSSWQCTQLGSCDLRSDSRMPQPGTYLARWWGDGQITYVCPGCKELWFFLKKNGCKELWFFKKK